MYWRTVLFFRVGNVSSVVRRKEMDIRAGVFKKIGRARRIPEKLAQYDDEFMVFTTYLYECLSWHYVYY